MYICSLNTYYILFKFRKLNLHGGMTECHSACDDRMTECHEVCDDSAFMPTKEFLQSVYADKGVRPYESILREAQYLQISTKTPVGSGYAKNRLVAQR